MDGVAVPSQSYSPQAEINWDRLDKTKFYAIGAGLFTSVTVALYPISVVKTRLQVTARQGSNPSAISIFKNILRADGISGLYRGFGTVVTGAVPGRIIFLTTLETTKIGALTFTEKLNLPEPTQAAIANGVAGMISSVAAQSVFVPLDVPFHVSSLLSQKWPKKIRLVTCFHAPVSLSWKPEVSQRLMVQGTSGATEYGGGFDAARKIIKADGIRGLYRGFGMSVLTYSPSSAVWWASYGSSQRFIWRSLGYSSKDNMQRPSQGQIMSVQALGGFFAGAVASCVTTPLDTIKTRLQVMDTESKPSVKRTIKRLIDEDGWKGLYRGIGPRFFSMSAWGTSMILAYEYLKRICAKHEND